MARGDGGNPVFEDNKNRYGGVDLMEKACARFGWRVHTWVLMGWVGENTGKRLRSWKWSSYGAYAGNKRPDWLETGKVLRAFQLSEDHPGGRAYAGYLEARANDAESAVTDDSLKELRRGWCLGERSFSDRILEALSGMADPKRKRGNVAGEAALVAVLIRQRTGVKNRWVAGRLGMGHEGNVTRAIRRVNEHPIRKTNLARLEAMLVSRD